MSACWREDARADLAAALACTRPEDGLPHVHAACDKIEQAAAAGSPEAERLWRMFANVSRSPNLKLPLIVLLDRLLEGGAGPVRHNPG